MEPSQQLSVTAIGDRRARYFVTSLNLAGHPMLKHKQKVQVQYFTALEYLVNHYTADIEYTTARLEQYRVLLTGQGDKVSLTDQNPDSFIKNIVMEGLWPWGKKYRYWLIADAALILCEKSNIMNVLKKMGAFLRKGQAAKLDGFVQTLFTDKAIPAEYAFAAKHIEQFRNNRRFADKIEKRFIVTANISAGKSTLINALVGKPITKTAQEACTAELCYIYNKPFDDETVHLMPPLKLSANYADLIGQTNTEESCVATYFNSQLANNCRVCIIDTPGVNSAVTPRHGEITRKVLLEERYDTLIYVFNSNKIATDDEIAHLKWVADNVSLEKVIFVLNKLDEFKPGDDDIRESIRGIRKDLSDLGYDNPAIYPMSACFAYLIKRKESSAKLSSREERKYRKMVEDFSDAYFDLSAYYPHDSANGVDVKCGIHGFEKILFGGSL